MTRKFPLVIALLVITSCQYTFGDIETQTEFENIDIPEGFSFNTLNQISAQQINATAGLVNVQRIENGDTLNLGLLTFGQSGEVLTMPNTGAEYLFTPMTPGKSGDFKIGDEPAALSKANTSLPDGTLTNITFHEIGTWNRNGVPKYLEPENDRIEQGLLDDISASLPEGKPVPSFNPQYLQNINMNTELTELADLWVTFVHEGAGWKNSLGYFTYDLNNPPTSADQIDSMKIIFPNVSYSGSGGGLTSGNKVYLGRFPANTGIGWFLIPDSWNSSTQKVDEKAQIKYSFREFNDYATAGYEQHLILLNDESRELLLLGFEDTTRPGGDNDFNDAIFCVTANPYEAVVTGNIQPIRKSVDEDGDGLAGELDQFPNDPERAYRSYYPAANATSTLLFEDLWPEKGDYDFNDLVLDYKYTFVKNADGLVKDLVIESTVKAVGGVLHNAFAWHLNIPASAVESVSGQQIFNNLIERQANGTEAKQQDAVIFSFDDSKKVLPAPSGYTVANVLDDAPKVDPVSSTLTITFTEAISQSELGTIPYDPFMVPGNNRIAEIHLKGYEPTPLADEGLFNTADDASTKGSDYYATILGHPWVLHIELSVQHPKENRDFSTAYTHFQNWVESNGTQYADWYQNKAGYRNTSLLYLK